MQRRTRGNTFVDLTSLLDVVLILLFALLMNMSLQQDRIESEAADLATQVEMTTADLDKLKTEKQALTEDIVTLQEQQHEINQAMLKWFTKESITSDKQFSTAEIDRLFDVEETNKSLRQLDFIANKFVIIEAAVDKDNQFNVVINNKSTNVQLNAALFNNSEAQSAAKAKIYEYIDMLLSKEEGGYEFVLLTLTDDGKMYKYAFDLIWSVFNDIEGNKKENAIYKMKYLKY